MHEKKEGYTDNWYGEINFLNFFLIFNASVSFYNWKLKKKKKEKKESPQKTLKGQRKSWGRSQRRHQLGQVAEHMNLGQWCGCWPRVENMATGHVSPAGCGATAKRECKLLLNGERDWLMNVLYQ